MHPQVSTRFSFLRDSAEYTLEHFQSIPITIMFDLLHVEDGINLKLYQYMANMNYEIGLFVDHTTKKKFEEGVEDPGFFVDLKNKFKGLFGRDLKFVYVAWTMTLEQTSILEANGLRSVLASFDFADTSYSALDIAEYRAIDVSQRSFIVVPDTHRPSGNSLVKDLVDIFDQAGFEIVPLSECLNVVSDEDDLVKHEL